MLTVVVMVVGRIINEDESCSGIDMLMAVFMTRVTW